MQLVISVATPDEPDPDQPGGGPVPPSGTPDWDVVMEVHKKTTLGALASAAAGTAGGGPALLSAPPFSPSYSPFDEPGPEETAETYTVVPYLDGVPMNPDATVEQVGLVSGERLGLNSPTPPADLDWRPAQTGVDWLEVHAVSGPDAGRVWPITFGSYGIGKAPGSWIRLTGDDLPDKGPELTVDHKGQVWLAGLGGMKLSQTGLTLADETATVEGGRLSLPEPPRDTAETAPDPRYRKALEDAAIEYAEMMKGAEGARLWPLDMDLAIGGSLLRLVRRFDADAALAPSEDEIARDFNRPPRLVPPLLQPPVKMPLPPKPPSRRQLPLLMMLSPMLIGLTFVYLFHSYYFLIITLLTPVMMLANWVQDRRSGAKQYRVDYAAYRVKRKEAEHKVFATINVERIARIQASPDPAMVGLIATGPGSRLWERRRTDPDFLVMRIGTVDQPSLLELEDPAREEVARRYRWNVPDVPIGVPVAERGVVGIVGTQEQTASITRWMVTQAATLHSPRDLRLYLLLAPAVPGAIGADPDRWGWARWLPQARPYGGQHGSPLVMFGNDPETIANRVNELSQLIKARQEARGSRMGTVLFAEPDVLVVMDGARWLRDVPGVMKILVEGPAVRVFTVAVDLMERLLPEECTAVVRADPDGLTLRQVNVPNVTEIRPDDVTERWSENVARSLSSLRDVTPDEIAGLPERVRLLELLHADPPTGEKIAGLWGRRPASTTFPLGIGFDGTINFDLVRDGPHGLIAGTTGSGKSELLQSLVSSLAAVNRPDELVFVLVDYKGGSAFHACVRLPHTLGMVTDLDEALSLRALESLGAELRRREQMLADVGAKDLPEYRALRQRAPEMAPMPRLLLVIDEFATMARETPSFVPGLVSIAQRGRSLGVHLILATQRPAGAVTADIKANTNLRIALRVTDPLESSDVIDVNDAAHISTRNPGRALARLGHRSVVPFQTAYVGSPSGPGEEEKNEEPEDVVVPPPSAERLTWNGLGRPIRIQQPPDEFAEMSLPGEESERTDLDDLVDAIRDAAERVESVQQPSPWLPALPGMLLLEDLDRADHEQGAQRVTHDNITMAPYAMADLPAMQAQHTLAFDPSRDGHLFVIGAPRAGRSQVLRTIAGGLARSNSSAAVHMYGIDAAGSALSVLTDLPHCGGVVPRTDIERLTRLIGTLGSELERRHDLQADHSVADLPELRVKMGPETAPPHIFVFVDGWDALAALLADHDGGAVYGQLQEVIREGAGVGIHMIMTSERVLLSGRVASLSENKLIMRMTDRAEMTLTGMPINRIPPMIPPGRAWRPKDTVEVQVAMLSADPTGQGQATALRAIGHQALLRDAMLPDSRRPVQIAALPSQLSFTDAFALWPKSEQKAMRGLLGLGGGGSTPLTLDFSGRAHSFVVAGPPGSGRSNVLASLGISLLATGTRLVVLTPRDSALRRLVNHQSVHLFSGPNPDADQVRNLLAPGCPPTVLLLDDVDLFGTGHPIGPVLREVAAVGRDRSVGMAFAGSAELISGTGAGWIGEAKRSRQGVLLAPQTSMEGDLLGIRLAHSQLRAAVRPGRGYTTIGAEPGKAQIIAIPLTMLK
ncbi:hypothetical protein KIH74_25400 [Kineosporia sp. J2-2]|uniref:FtsK domain-containing protein n=1 Tax=Kineosporia corallincola TaxID=2835133 RepID=A0ABS5TMH8_9ACTN|nr:FtsK/SpoIIIE domain-containing protein [Kineosporia corallincola]MBT0772306.1 hypothetical protein [Kineosporia corallincola]